MNQHVILEKVKEQINDRKVVAGVFYTFNFDVTFFENYLLPVFLPHVPFSDNEIQNKILWRQHAKSLPPITVYCDFHAKGPNAPSLAYKVIPIDLEKKGGRKPCFHPKISFILLEDQSMIVLIGSCNLTMGGWCTNKEVVSIVELKNNKNLPHGYKFNLKKFFENVANLSSEKNYSDAEKMVHRFLKSSLYTEESETCIDFHNSFSNNFKKELDNIWKLNENEPFEQIEIISPYITQGEAIINQALVYVKKGNLLLTTPYSESNRAEITQENHEKFAKIGITWAIFINPGKEKGFRFNHSKIYRLKGKNKMHTIVGSVNFTKAAWDGVNKNGNVESAVLYTEPVDNWVPWLMPDNNTDIEFAEKQGNETKDDNRKDVPNISFVLDWYKKMLTYRLIEPRQFSGKILFDGDTGKIIRPGTNKINLTPDWIKSLSLNSIIKIRFNRDIFYYYPEQVGIENRPLSLKLKMTDQEILSLWENISIKSDKKSQISNLIENYIREKTDSEGNLINDESNTKRTLNLMASHISALINLEKILYKIPPLVREFDAAKEIFQYYLYIHNIDTLKGYREMLLDMYVSKDLLPGFYWLLLEIIKKDFYRQKKNNAFFRAVRGDTGKLRLPQTTAVNDIDNEINAVKNDLRGVKNFDTKLINWIRAEL